MPLHTLIFLTLLFLCYFIHRNITPAHLKEIFGHFGPVKNVDLQVDPRLNISKGFAYVEYENAIDASKGEQYMDGGQVDGNRIKVTFVLVSNKRARPNSPGGSRGRRSASPAARQNAAPRRDVGGMDRGADRGMDRGGSRDMDRRAPRGDWRGRGDGGRGRSPDRRRERSPVGYGRDRGRDSGGFRQGSSPARRR
jgi:RNA-binding protein with serine-rich domain 1